MAHELEVWLFAEKVGTLSLVGGRLHFCYHAAWLASANKVRAPKMDYPPLRIVRFSGAALTDGNEDHQIEGVTRYEIMPAGMRDAIFFRNSRR